MLLLFFHLVIIFCCCCCFFSFLLGPCFIDFWMKILSIFARQNNWKVKCTKTKILPWFFFIIFFFIIDLFPSLRFVVVCVSYFIKKIVYFLSLLFYLWSGRKLKVSFCNCKFLRLEKKDWKEFKKKQTKTFPFLLLFNLSTVLYNCFISPLFWLLFLVSSLSLN